jgi:hypothetical protein
MIDSMKWCHWLASALKNEEQDSARQSAELRQTAGMYAGVFRILPTYVVLMVFFGPASLRAADPPPNLEKQPAPNAPEAYGITTRTPPVLNTAPGVRYQPRLRMWQGIPSIERTKGGRLWATWYAGPLSEGSEGNYALLVTSADDGRTWSGPVAVFDPTPFFGGNTGDPHLWLDPTGRLWWFVNRVLKVKDPAGIRSLWGFPIENADEEAGKFGPPVFAGYGIGLNKPTALAAGAWLRPLDTFNPKDPLRTLLYASRDEGRTFAPFAKVAIPDVSFSEHMVATCRDGSLLLVARTTYGVAESRSTDGGKTWSEGKPLLTGVNVNTRCFLTRLPSGNLLMVVNDHPKSRTNLTAIVSEDDGRTWPHKLLLDERPTVSYPDGTVSEDGAIHVAYDRGRYALGEQEILFARFTEADVKAGKLVTEGSRLKQLINRLSDTGGGVQKTREPQLLEEAFK